MNLQDQLAQLQQQIATEKQKGAEQDKFLVAQLETQEAALLEQIMNAQVEHNHEERVADAQQKVAYILDSIQVGGLSMRQLCAGDDEFELLYGKFAQLLEVQAESSSAQIKGFEERDLQRDRQIDNLQIRNSDLERENSRLAAWANEQETRADDAESKRDAAGTRIAELESENAQLKSWNDDLQLQISRGVSGAIRVVDAEEEAKRAAAEQEMIERVRAQKTIYDLKPDNDINPKNYTAIRALDGETITFNWTQKNSYIVLQDENQVNQFRLQHQAQSAIPNLPLDEPVEVTPPALEDVTQGQFREGAADVGGTAASTEDIAGDDGQSVGSTDDRSVLAAKVTALESTVDTLTADVEVLKRRVGWVA